MRRAFAIAGLVLAAGSVHADVIVDWNQELLSAIQENNVAPPAAARLMAMTHLAQYDAINSITDARRSYAANMVCSPTTSKEAAAASAAHRVLSQAFPTRATQLNARLASHLGAIPEGPNKAEGLSVGTQCADAIFGVRSSDNSGNGFVFTGSNATGQWRQTPNAPGSGTSAPGALPHWRTVTPFAVSSASQFAAPVVPSLTSQAYTDAYNQVKDLGSQTSTTRTAYQTDTAFLWRAGGNTVTPPGQWNQVAQQLAVANSLSLEDSSRMFALLGMAVADAGITAWESKYRDNFWRPITGIREGDSDGNDATVGDANWTPLFQTPNHPSYVSGHSTFSAAAAAALAGFFGSDAHTFTVTGDGRTRQYASLEDAAYDAGMSRIYGGIHWMFDNTAGLESGANVGAWVASTQLTVPSPAGFALLGLGGVMVARRRRA